MLANFLIRRWSACLLGAVLLIPTGGCALLGGSPSTANIDLRKKNQALSAQIDTLKQQAAAQDEVIKGLRERQGTLPTLPPDRLAKLWTTHGLKFGRLTGGWDADEKKPGDEGVQIYVYPTDQDGQSIKATGSFKVELFDLADVKEPLIGKWTFDLDAAKKAWRGNLADYNYVLQCPWKQRVPAHEELTMKIEFLDELTQTPFHAQQVIKVHLQGTTRASPTTQRAGPERSATRRG